MEQELQHIISSKRALLARGDTPRSAVNYTEGMASEQKDRFIEYLIEQNEDQKLTIRAMQSVLEDFRKEQELTNKLLSDANEKSSRAMAEANAKVSEVLSQLETLQAEFRQERKESKAKDRKIARLQERLNLANKNQYGSKSQKSKGKDSFSEEDADRTQEKDNFDGTAGSIGSEVKEASKTSDATPQPRDLSNRPTSYSRMGVEGGTIKTHLTDRSKVPGRIIESDAPKMIRVFSLQMSLVEERFELVHYVPKGGNPRWGYFPKEGHPQFVTKFDGTKATPEFMQAIAYEVYVKNVTFGLLHQWLKDMGMSISRNTLHNWLRKGKVYLDEMVKALKEIALEKDSIVHCDETWCKVRKYDHYKKCYMWVLVNKAEKVAIFFYDNGSRGRKVLTDFLGEADLKALMSDGYNAYTFIGNELQGENLKNTIHQVCMAHLRAKFWKALSQAHDERARIFLYIINSLYGLEETYDKEEINIAERTLRRNSLETKSLLIDLRQHLDIELSRPVEERSGYLTEALNYLKHFWKELTVYVTDGALPIDNNIAERTVRCMTTARNNSLHFGSDVGAEMAATYHSIISTVKLHGKSVWNYLGEFFKKIFEGCRDYSTLLPSALG